MDNASPATVSRNGMIYMSSSGLDWKPKLTAWFNKHDLADEHKTPLLALFNASFESVWKYANANLRFVMNILQGWKFMSCSHCQELCQPASWLLISFTRMNNLN